MSQQKWKDRLLSSRPRSSSSVREVIREELRMWEEGLEMSRCLGSKDLSDNGS
jgi:hypothetical protein